MRLLITWMTDHPEIPVPGDMPRRVNAWIYRVLTHADPDWATALHAHDPTQKTRIRPFAAPWIQRIGGRNAPVAQGVFGTLDPRIADAMTRYATAEPLELGSPWRVLAVTPLPDGPLTSPRWFSVTTPVVVASHGQPGRRFLRPTDAEFVPLLRRNLAHKADQFCGASIPVEDIRLTATARWQFAGRRAARYAVDAWWPGDPLRLEAPPPVLQVAETLGLGVYNAAGYGCVAPQADRWAVAE